MAWLVAIVGTADLFSATAVGISQKLTDTASNWSWFILAFYVPFLWVAAIMLFCQLIARRREPLAGPASH